jgi:hypothetical protein
MDKEVLSMVEHFMSKHNLCTSRLTSCWALTQRRQDERASNIACIDGSFNSQTLSSLKGDQPSCNQHKETFTSSTWFSRLHITPGDELLEHVTLKCTALSVFRTGLAYIYAYMYFVSTINSEFNACSFSELTDARSC